MVDKEELKTVLKKLRTEEDLTKIEERLRPLLQNVDPETLSLAEQELIDEGFSPEEIRRLCDIHLKVVAVKEEEQSLEESHPLSILKSEHEIILNNLRILEDVLSKIRLNNSPEKLNEELKRLEAVIELLLEAENHHRREEMSLFPRLEEYGISGPPNVMRMEHDDLRSRKKALKSLLDEHSKLDSKHLANKVYEIGNYITIVLRDHIFKENNILYPLALKVVQEGEWKKIKDEFDSIGYCCFTPGVKAHREHHY
ncbi:MAG: DUF438 domain-containing protein [Nitrososphaeria archaeon]